MNKQQIKITVNDITANYLRNSLLGTSACVEELVRDALDNATMGIDRRTKKDKNRFWNIGHHVTVKVPNSYGFA